MTKEEAHKEIANLVAQAEKLILQAEIIADLEDIGFALDIGGYGMGGYYDGEAGAWNASSHSC